VARLPEPGKDVGTWGIILNDFLNQSHNADGSIKNNVVTPAALAGNIPQSKIANLQTDISRLANTSGENTGDQTLPTTLAELSDDSAHRLTTDTEKSTWNAKQNAMGSDDNYVTDTEKSNLHAPHSDDQDLSGKVDKVTGSRLITSAESTLLGNTSNTNSGDNATNTQYSGLAASKENVANKVTAFSTPTDTQYPSAKLTSDQLVLKEVLTNKSTDITADGASDTKYPSVKSVKSYVDPQITDLKSDSDMLKSITISGEYKALDISDQLVNGHYLNKLGNATVSSTAYCTDFIGVTIGDVFYYRLCEDYNNSYDICIYDANKNFIKGINISTSATSYSFVNGSYTIDAGAYIRVASLVQYSSLYKEYPKSNTDVFNSYSEKIGELDDAVIDITNELIAIGMSNTYLNGSGGAVTGYSGGFTTDFMDVEEGDILNYISYVLYSNPSYVMYDKYKHLYSLGGRTTGYNSGSITIPPVVNYIRFATLDIKKTFYVAKQSKKSVIDKITELTTPISFVVPSQYAEVALNASVGYVNTAGFIESGATDYNHSDYIDVTNYDWFRAVVNYGWDAVAYAVYDATKTKLYALTASSGTSATIDITVSDLLTAYPTAKYIRFTGSSSGIKILKVFAKKKTASIESGLLTALSIGNTLYGKKIAFCGDSFLEASNLGSNYYDAFCGCYKSFGWRIANRNGMSLYHDGISGSTMHIVNTGVPSTNYPFSYTRYQNVPSDANYIILQFGLNESAIADNVSTLGTSISTDATTMWGSWNTVLGYLITNHPIARIGIIMSDAWMPQSYFTALKQIAEWWGIPLLDLGGDASVPLMNGGRRANSGLALNPAVAILRNQTFYNNYGSGDSHPNDAGHEWRSTVIENFIRSL